MSRTDAHDPWEVKLIKYYKEGRGDLVAIAHYHDKGQCDFDPTDPTPKRWNRNSKHCGLESTHIGWNCEWLYYYTWPGRAAWRQTVTRQERSRSKHKLRQARRMHLEDLDDFYVPYHYKDASWWW